MKQILAWLGAALLLALGQQQLLRQRPPRLLQATTQPPGSGAAALELRFSRPINSKSLRQGVALKPPLPFELLGQGSRWRLQIPASQRINGPLLLRVAGRDLQGQPLGASQWRWDPRPTLVAARPVAGGDQLQRWDGRQWQPLGPVHGPVQSLLPLGNGAGVVTVTAQQPMAQQIWRLKLDQRLRPQGEQQLNRQPLIYAHLSSNQTGALLVQSSEQLSAESHLQLWPPEGNAETLKLAASGAIQLVPQGGWLVLPETDGLALRSLPPLAPQRQFLPGSRDLSSFCPEAGRALLVRHWPDYRRSLEFLEPGRPPRQIWVGNEALVASACAGGGERLWVLLISGLRVPELEILELNRQGKQLRRQRLQGLELDPGSGLHYDPASQQLLLLLRPLNRPQGAASLAQATLLDASSLRARPLVGGVRQVGWLVSKQLERQLGPHP